MDGFFHTHSPIAWPKSDKKRKPFTPDSVTRDSKNKLSSKKKDSERSGSGTPTGAYLKWPLPSRSSMETFHRVYNEMTNTPTEKRGSPSSPALAHRTRYDLKLHRHPSDASDKGLNSSPVHNVRRSKSLASLSPVIILSSSDDDSKPTPTYTTQKKLVLDTSSDDDSFSLPPPLHERLTLSSGPSHKNPQSTKISRGKENNPRLKSHLKKRIVFDDSSSSESSLPDLLTKKLDLIKVPSKPLLLDDSSSEPELPILPSNNQSTKPLNSVLKKLPVTEPNSCRHKPVFTLLQDGLLSRNTELASAKDFPNRWMCKESLEESSRFLKSLSDSSPIDPSTAHFRNKFSKHKEDLVKKLYKILNQTVFENKLAPDMSITWNIRLTKTAGYCYMRSHRDQSRTARIELSTKVLDSAERVRDTLLHELCHAAAFVIHGYRDGHGPLFKLWGQKAGILFPFLPVVSRCHTYQINTKYTYRCIKCKGTIGRHSRSVDMNRKGCGRCGGRFELLVNGVPEASSQKKTSEFAKFVKDNYRDVKQLHRDMKHGDIMQKLGEMFSEKSKS